MNFQNETFPEGAVKMGSTSSMTEETVVPGILKKHLTPKGKFGYLVVEEGSLQFVWEDEMDIIIDADPEHPIIIVPERYHHVVITGKVRFRVEFYMSLDGTVTGTSHEGGSRPGEDFV